MTPKFQKEPVEKRCVHVVKVNADADETFDFWNIPYIGKLRGYGTAEGLIPLTQVRLYVVGSAVPHPCGDCPVL